MKLSTAMRIGSMTTRQIKRQWSDGGNGRCALGAIASAYGFNDLEGGNNCLTQIFNKYAVLSIAFPHPIDGKYYPLSSIIADLNDNCSYSREQIADWIEEVIEKDETLNETKRLQEVA